MVKIKGKVIVVNGVRVGEIRGWRNPAGIEHVPYQIILDSGEVIGPFSYAADAQKVARYKFSK